MALFEPGHQLQNQNHIFFQIHNDTWHCRSATRKPADLTVQALIDGHGKAFQGLNVFINDEYASQEVSVSVGAAARQVERTQW